METVTAREIISYECNCPVCDENIYSEVQNDWNIYEMVHTDQIITCDDCGCEFKVSL